MRICSASELSMVMFKTSSVRMTSSTRSRPMVGCLAGRIVKPMIDLETLNELFAGVRAKTDWNIDGPMLWGYFFMDHDEEKLKETATHLVEQGYCFVDIHEANDRSTLVLHME